MRQVVEKDYNMVSLLVQVLVSFLLMVVLQNMSVTEETNISIEFSPPFIILLPQQCGFTRYS